MITSLAGTQVAGQADFHHFLLRWLGYHQDESTYGCGIMNVMRSTLRSMLQARSIRAGSFSRRGWTFTVLDTFPSTATITSMDIWRRTARLIFIPIAPRSALITSISARVGFLDFVWLSVMTH